MSPQLPGMPHPFGPSDAQTIVTYLQKRVRVENLDEATALSNLVQSFVQFANRTFDEIAAKQRAAPPVSSSNTMAPPAAASAVANTDEDGTASD